MGNGSLCLGIAEKRKFKYDVVYVVELLTINLGIFIRDICIWPRDGSSWDKFFFEWHKKHLVDVRGYEFCILDELSTMKLEWMKMLYDDIYKVLLGVDCYKSATISMYGVKVLAPGDSFDELCVNADIYDTV